MKNQVSKDLTVCGRNAVDALASIHPERVRRLFFTLERAPALGNLCKRLAAEKKIYRMVETSELEKICGSTHHNGVAAVIDLPEITEPGPLEITAWCKNENRLIVLDGVANSHNLGSIVRTAAFLGINDLVISGHLDRSEQLVTTSMYRTAEGGMEHVTLWRIDNLTEFMDRFGMVKALENKGSGGIAFIAADHRADRDVRELPIAIHDVIGNKPGTALAVVLGNEVTGIDAGVKSRCLIGARVNGSGKVESLNVAQAAAIFMFALGGV